MRSRSSSARCGQIGIGRQRLGSNDDPGDRERPTLLSQHIVQNPRSSPDPSFVVGPTVALLSRLSNDIGEQGGATEIRDQLTVQSPISGQMTQ